MSSFVIVGSGWRARFFMRIANNFPGLFDLKYVLCRSREKAELLSAELGVKTTLSESECVEAGPDFVVVAVSKGDNFAVASHWASLGFPVLMETPAGASFEELCELWELHEGGAKIAVAEQYFRYPLIAAGLRAVDGGLIGEPDCVELSLVHDYHAASLIRRMLMLHKLKKLPEFTLRAREYVYPVEETDSRGGPIKDGTVKERGRVRADIDFEGGKRAFYDFDGVQYHTAIRARHINVRGVRGEWNDTVVRYVSGGHEPGMLRLTAAAVPGYERLMTRELEDMAWSPFVHMENAQDEYAIATLMLDMGAYINGGPEPYPLREALEDAYMWQALARALETGDEQGSGPRPWA